MYRWVIKLMLDSELVPEQRLVFVDIARKLNVSRTPVNNALAILAQEGYLDFVPNQGYAVRRLSRQEKQDLYEIRETIETGFIGQAIRKMTARPLKNIARKMAEVDKYLAGNGSRQIFLHDMELHEAILLVAGNVHVMHRYREICQKLYICFRPEGIQSSPLHALCEEHDSLYQAVQHKDIDQAREVLRQHRNILETFEKPQAPDTRARQWRLLGSPASEVAIPYHI